MGAAEFFLLAHSRSHSGRLVGVEALDVSFYEDRALHGLTEAQMRMRPHDLNSIAWILWHIARTEDFGANLLVAGRPQVLDEEDWPRHLGVARRDIGTGMTAEEVAEIGDRLDIEAAREYRLVVGRRTREIVGTLRPEDWDAAIDEARVQRAFDAGALLPGATWPRPWFTGKSVAWVLSWPCLGHNNMHLGQAMWVKRLVRR
ncbi:MAG: DinB family protein [Armatimonadetes bacterium]|nr:DinB family protein [Armatimonadota bacterium]